MSEHDDDPQIRREYPISPQHEVVFSGHGLICFEVVKGKLKLVVKYRGDCYRRERLTLDLQPPDGR